MTADIGDPDQIRAWLARLPAGSPEWEGALTLGSYLRAGYGTPDGFYDRLVRRFIEPIDDQVASAVDLGCGVGALAHRLGCRPDRHVVGLDRDLSALQWAAIAAQGRPLLAPTLEGIELVDRPLDPTPACGASLSWVCGDVLAPPLTPASHDLVAAVNLIDSVADPWLALGQASALTRPGGWLLIAHPGTWSAAVTPPDRWVRPTEWMELFDHYGLDVVDQEDGIDWVLERSPRVSFHYKVATVLTQRRT